MLSTTYKDRADKMMRQVVLMEMEEEKAGWEGKEWVLRSLVLQWVQDSNTEGNKDLFEVWVAE